MITSRLFEKICPRCIVRKTNKKDDSGSLKLIPSRRTANLRWIYYNMPEPIFLRLLLCKESNKLSDPDCCPYPKYKNMFAIKRLCLCSSKENLAHIYFGYEQPEKVNKKGTRSSIVFFSKNNQDTDKVTQTLKATVKQLEQLGIGREKIDFYVVPFYYEKIPLIPINRRKLIKGIIDEYADAKVEVKETIALNDNNLTTLEINQNRVTNSFSIEMVVYD